MSLSEKIKNYSDLTLLVDLPVGSLFSDFCVKSIYCKITEKKCMCVLPVNLNSPNSYEETKGDIYEISIFKKPVIPLTDLSGETSSNPSLVKLGELNNGDIFISPEYFDEDTFFVCYKRIVDELLQSFFIIQYREFRYSADKYQAKGYTSGPFSADMFVFPVKDLKITEHQEYFGHYVTLEQRETV